MFEKVITMIADRKEIDPSEIKMETTFEELGMDSLDTVELVMSFEDEFGVTIEVEEGLKTIADLVALIERLTA